MEGLFVFIGKFKAILQQIKEGRSEIRNGAKISKYKCPKLPARSLDIPDLNFELVSGFEFRILDELPFLIFLLYIEPHEIKNHN